MIGFDSRSRFLPLSGCSSAFFLCAVCGVMTAGGKRTGTGRCGRISVQEILSDGCTGCLSSFFDWQSHFLSSGFCFYEKGFVIMAKYAVIKQNYEFRRAYNKGRNFVSPYLVTYCFKKKYGGVKIGITSGKKIGKAVVRNRCRRVIREAFRSLYQETHGNWDIIFVARSATVYKKSTEISVIMRKHLKEAGVLS